MTIFKYHTLGYQGSSVEFSCFYNNQLGVVTSQNYGICGNGRLYVLFLNNDVELYKTYDTQNALYDLSFSEINNYQCVVASGDGSLKLFDFNFPDFPVKNYHEHSKEVLSVDWNLVKKDTFISGSWDACIKLWDPIRNVSLNTWKEHTACIYQTMWSPWSANVFASVSGDFTCKLWDSRQSKCSHSFIAHHSEVLTLDWNKYEKNTIVTGGVDKSIRIWDLRNTSNPKAVLNGHEFAVKRVKCSPHKENIIASCSYDTKVIVWDGGNKIFVNDNHSEFVSGIDFSLFDCNLIASCGWDQNVEIVKF